MGNCDGNGNSCKRKRNNQKEQIHMSSQLRMASWYEHGAGLKRIYWWNNLETQSSNIQEVEEEKGSFRSSSYLFKSFTSFASPPPKQKSGCSVNLHIFLLRLVIISHAWNVMLRRNLFRLNFALNVIISRMLQKIKIFLFKLKAFYISINIFISIEKFDSDSFAIWERVFNKPICKENRNW